MLTQFLEKRLLPLAEVISNNIYINALKNAFIIIMPFLIVGSSLLLIINFPIAGYNEFITNLLGTQLLDNLNQGVNVTYGIMTILVIFSMSRELTEEFKLTKSATILPVSIYFLMFNDNLSLPSGDTVKGAYYLTQFGAESMFLGVVITLSTILLFKKLSQSQMLTIRMPDSVPPEIINSFKSLFPIGGVLIFWILVKFAFQQTSYNDMATFINVILQQPLLHLGGSIVAQVLTEILTTLFWFFGLHGSTIVGSIMGPVWNTLSAENLAATQAGLEPLNIINQQFRDVFLVSGGTGFTLALLICIFMSAKSQRLNTIAKISAPAAIFNINEPIIFGIPIVLNPIMLIPFILTPAVLCLTTYTAMYLGYVPVTSGVAIPWTTPIFISGFLTTGYQGVILQFVNLIIGVVIYFPFVKALDKQYMDEELEQEAQQKQQEATA